MAQEYGDLRADHHCQVHEEEHDGSSSAYFPLLKTMMTGRCTGDSQVVKLSALQDGSGEAVETFALDKRPCLGAPTPTCCCVTGQTVGDSEEQQCVVSTHHDTSYDGNVGALGTLVTVLGRRNIICAANYNSEILRIGHIHTCLE